jgi:multiple sugar transport system substrate-binding protein
MRKKILLVFLVLAAMLLAACAPAATPTPQIITKVETRVVEKEKQVVITPTPAPVKLVMLTHWGEESVLKPMQALLDEYTKLHPNVTIEYQTVTFDQLLTKITTARAAGISPDIYHFYNLWTPEFVKGGMLSVPPEEVIADIKANYGPGSVQAVTYMGQIWGYPTEINTYLLIYNKKMFKEAGYDKPPETWDQLREMAAKLKQVDESGKVTRAGFLLIPGWDSGVVHPFLSLLWSNGGEYLSADGSKALFNSPEGKATLKLYMDMLKDKSIDVGISGWDFPSGKGAMIIMANWWRATLKDTFADGYENVGVAPIPHGPNGKSSTLQYNWLFGVDNGSKHREEAWKLVQWLNTPRKEGAASPIGDFLTSALGAMPSRLSDQVALADRYDDFMKAYIDSTAVARPEPVVPGGQEVKTTLQTEIEAAWYGKKPYEKALADAAEEADRILAEKK